MGNGLLFILGIRKTWKALSSALLCDITGQFCLLEAERSWNCLATAKMLGISLASHEKQ